MAQVVQCEELLLEAAEAERDAAWITWAVGRPPAMRTGGEGVGGGASDAPSAGPPSDKPSDKPSDGGTSQRRVTMDWDDDNDDEPAATAAAAVNPQAVADADADAAATETAAAAATSSPQAVAGGAEVTQARQAIRRGRKLAEAAVEATRARCATRMKQVAHAPERLAKIRALHERCLTGPHTVHDPRRTHAVHLPSMHCRSLICALRVRHRCLSAFRSALVLVAKQQPKQQVSTALAQHTQ